MPSRVRNVAKPKISEKHIQETCSAFLALDGWRRVRTDLAHLRGMGVQERGMADDLYIRYIAGSDVHHTAESRMSCYVLWIEWKRRTGKVAANQHAWHAAERARGAFTMIAGLDFTASIEGFMEWYATSGLARKVR